MERGINRCCRRRWYARPAHARARPIRWLTVRAKPLGRRRCRLGAVVLIGGDCISSSSPSAPSPAGDGPRSRGADQARAHAYIPGVRARIPADYIREGRCAGGCFVALHPVAEGSLHPQFQGEARARARSWPWPSWTGGGFLRPVDVPFSRCAQDCRDIHGSCSLKRTPTGC
jgi:hypothetical protein